MNKTTVIGTALKGSWGGSVVTSFGTILFNHEGFAEIPTNVAEALIENFSDAYYIHGDEMPVPKQAPEVLAAHDDPSVKEFTRNLARQNNAESLARSKGEMFIPSANAIAVSSQEEKKQSQILNAQGDAIKTESVDENVEIEVEQEEIVEEVVEEEATEEVVEEVDENTAKGTLLSSLEIGDIQDLLIEANVPAKEFAAIEDKAKLVEFAVSTIVSVTPDAAVVWSISMLLESPTNVNVILLSSVPI